MLLSSFPEDLNTPWIEFSFWKEKWKNFLIVVYSALLFLPGLPLRSCLNESLTRGYLKECDRTPFLTSGDESFKPIGRVSQGHGWVNSMLEGCRISNYLSLLTLSVKAALNGLSLWGLGWLLSSSGFTVSPSAKVCFTKWPWSPRMQIRYK